MSNQSLYDTLRQTYPEFVYESYRYDVQSDGLHIVFTFRIGADILFQPDAFLPARPFLDFNQPQSVLDALVFNIGMIELVSYWKSCCPPQITVACGGLDETQAGFWKKIYYNGLGEFFYVNGIQATVDDFVSIRSCGAPIPPFTSPLATGTRPLALVPIGGGKDSVVTLELLSRHAGRAARPIPLIMNPRGATVGCIEAAGYTMDDVLVIRRSIHPRLLELNAQGFLNGHTPFSAMLAFYTLLASQLSGVPMIALSNEGSANESTVVGTTVNHQYSKSLEFENDFRAYAERYISPSNFNYFSFLRPLSELQIAMLFSGYPHYFPVFKSCNAGSKQDIWCGHCAKCLFAYIILSPFIEPQRLNAIFGKCMLDDMTLQHEFDQLAGSAETKPFECVGTISEVHSALSMAIGRWYHDERPALLRGYRPMEPVTPLHRMSAEHNVPPQLCATLLPALYAHLRVLVAGYGREGKSTETYLRANLPPKQLDIAANDEEIFAALDKRPPYDLIFKSPGIPTMKLEGRCSAIAITSQADCFLDRYAPITIGITGTKGKSTTTTLIHHVLRHAFPTRNVVLAGNMGIPLLDIAPQLDEDAIVVAEFSCHQLENICTAPHISVILNLYQEHLDHYRSYRDYQMAKMQIMLRQDGGGHCFYCTDSDDLRELMGEVGTSALSQLHPYSLEDARKSQLRDLRTTLRGDHNLSNIYVAREVTRLLGVTDSQFAEALATFTGLPHRLELVGTYGGITFYNDSISTIPEAAIAAIEALRDVDTLILGGFDRGIDYSPLYRYLADSDAPGCRIRNIALVGEAGRRMKAESGLFDSRNTLVEDDYARIVAWCAQVTQQGRGCLLSPAAASYDAFRNFEHRGETYKQLILNYPWTASR